MNSLKFTHIFAVLLVICMIPSTAFAYETNQDDSIQLRYSQICYFTIDFDISSAGLASCYSHIETDTASNGVALNMQLQRSSNGRTWSKIHEWSTDDKQTVSLDKTYYVSSGYLYRIHVTATVSNSTGRVLETATRDSSTVRY